MNEIELMVKGLLFELPPEAQQLFKETVEKIENTVHEAEDRFPGVGLLAVTSIGSQLQEATK